MRSSSWLDGAIGKIIGMSLTLVTSYMIATELPSLFRYARMNRVAKRGERPFRRYEPDTSAAQYAQAPRRAKEADKHKGRERSPTHATP
jgi:hypothetical protein